MYKTKNSILLVKKSSTVGTVVSYTIIRENPLAETDFFEEH